MNSKENDIFNCLSNLILETNERMNRGEVKYVIYEYQRVPIINEIMEQLGIKNGSVVDDEVMDVINHQSELLIFLKTSVSNTVN